MAARSGRGALGWYCDDADDFDGRAALDAGLRMGEMLMEMAECFGCKLVQPAQDAATGFTIHACRRCASVHMRLVRSQPSVSSSLADAQNQETGERPDSSPARREELQGAQEDLSVDEHMEQGRFPSM